MSSCVDVHDYHSSEWGKDVWMGQITEEEEEDEEEESIP